MRHAIDAGQFAASQRHEKALRTQARIVLLKTAAGLATGLTVGLALTALVLRLNEVQSHQRRIRADFLESRDLPALILTPAD